MNKKLLDQESKAVLAENQELRKAKHRDLKGIGRVQLRIPEQFMPVLEKLNPDLFCLDKQIKERAWRKFANSRESIPFRVNDKRW